MDDERVVSSELPMNIRDWDRVHVRRWMLEIKVDKEDADILFNERINGDSLLLMVRSDLAELQLSFNVIKLIIHNLELLKQKSQWQNDVVTCSLKPYPFGRFTAAHRYRENSILDVTETGPIDLIQPCHEYKEFTNTTEDSRTRKFIYEVLRFTASCLNSRTNGTIHFGVADKPHGQVLGVHIQKTDGFDVQQSHAIEKHFRRYKQVQVAKRCINPPRFVEVLKADMTLTEKHVIEVDIEPFSIVCKEMYFSTYEVEMKNKNNENKAIKKMKKQNDSKSFFVRDGSSSRNLITSGSLKEFEEYTADANMQELSQLRKKAEEKHLSVVKNSVEGSKLCEMITGGTHSLDKSHFSSYIVVTNKSHPVQPEHLSFLLHMDLVAVLDLDPESAQNGLKKHLEDRKIFSVHLPADYKITEAATETVERFKVTKNTSWVFCNGGIHEEKPSDDDNWLIEKGSSVRDVVSFMFSDKVKDQNKLLVIFLLLSQVSDGNDPLVETFNMFLQELKRKAQILCIADNETSYTYWKDLVNGRCGVDISERCIHELSLAEVNGTILSLCSDNRKSRRFLPGRGGARVELSKKTEDSLDLLSILCVNQCEGGHKDKWNLRSRNASWYTIYFSYWLGSMKFFRCDKLDYIVKTIIPDLLNRKSVCVFFNIFSLPGCGGATLALHVLWTLKERFRCVELKDSTEDYTAVAQQVVQFLTYETKEEPTRLPVLLMIDD